MGFFFLQRTVAARVNIKNNMPSKQNKKTNNIPNKRSFLLFFTSCCKFLRVVWLLKIRDSPCFEVGYPQRVIDIFSRIVFFSVRVYYLNIHYVQKNCVFISVKLLTLFASSYIYTTEVTSILYLISTGVRY